MQIPQNKIQIPIRYVLLGFGAWNLGFKLDTMKLTNVASFFIVAIGIIAALVYGQGLFIPLILAVLLWFIMRKLKMLLDKIEFVRERVPSWVKTVISGFIIVVVINIAANILASNINNLAQSYPKYQPNIKLIISQLSLVFNVDLIEMIKVQSADFNIGAVLGPILNSLSGIIGKFFLIIVYALFILFEESFFNSKLDILFKDKNEYEKFSHITKKIEDSITGYLGVKTFTSLLTGSLSYIVLLLIGIDSPVFWAFLIFLLNYIPTVGSLVATALPALFCLLQFGGFQEAIIVLTVVGAVQLLIGSLLEPRLLGSSMNISPLVVILSLSVWGLLWGPTGMILSIPITVTMVIVFAQFESTRPAAIMLSEKGKVDVGFRRARRGAKKKIKK